MRAAPDLVAARARMVAEQIAARGVRDERVLDAMRRIPREVFVPEEARAFAYEDRPLPIGWGQTISQPFIVALMAEAAAIGAGDRVLEVGAGSGCAAAVMGRLAREVIAVERIAALAERARATLAGLGVANVEIVTGDGTRGLPERAPFDAILAAAGGPVVPPALLEQLSEGGRLVMPVGERDGVQQLVRMTRTVEGVREERLGEVRFVPLVGAQGWSEDDGPGFEDDRRGG